MTIHKNEIKIAFERIMEKLEYEGIEQIEINTDWYRFIPADEWKDFTKDVVEVGSLNDDAESLKLMINDKNRQCTYVDFDRLASILRAISQEMNPPST